MYRRRARIIPIYPFAQSQSFSCNLRTASTLAEGFFDHLIRSSESYAEKWEYVRENPVRAGLVTSADDWPWQGEIEYLE
jgi:hypothetical protein